MKQKLKIKDLEILNSVLNIAAVKNELPYKVSYAIGRTEVEVRAAITPFQNIMHEKTKSLWPKYCKLDENGKAKTKARFENQILVQEPEFINEEQHSKFFDEYEAERLKFLEEEVEVDFYTIDFQTLPKVDQDKYFNCGLEPFAIVQLEKYIILNVDHE